MDFQGGCSDLEEEEECTPLVVRESEEPIVLSYFAKALLMHLEVVHVPFVLFHGDVHGLHPAVLNSRFIGRCPKLYLLKVGQSVRVLPYALNRLYIN